MTTRFALLVALLSVGILRGQTGRESFSIVVKKVRSEPITLRVPASAPSSVRSAKPTQVDGFRIWAETKTSRFELTGFIHEPMTEDECKKYFNQETCKIQSIGRPEVGKQYDATRSGSAMDLLCLLDPRGKTPAGDCYQIELEEAKK
jgi:hypothetical protein